MKIDMKNFMFAFPDFKVEDLVAYADSSSVVVLGNWSGTFRGEYMNMSPTNKSYKSPDADIYTFNKDGKITSHKSIQSDATFTSQLSIPTN